MFWNKDCSLTTGRRRWSLASLTKGLMFSSRKDKHLNVEVPEKDYQPYVPSYARTGFLANATPRHMRVANEIL
ncbi:hypothetical protein ACRALDRAFT_2042058 [Sodiomyces alcalophilus JCM 7366]|uniref:uncharacterized protein n=1 Tax=Sodiomyces alcalophilus JCM 7366 TaxID=591952 RepID=UPI0039B45677